MRCNRLFESILLIVIILVVNITYSISADIVEELYKKSKELYMSENYTEAINNAQLALVAAEEQYGKDSIDIANILKFLSMAHEKLKQYEQSVNYLERVREIQEIRLGEDHRDVARTISMLIRLYEKQGDKSKVNEYSELADARWGDSGNNKQSSKSNISTSDESLYTGSIAIKDKDGVYGSSGSVFIFESEAAINECYNEFRISNSRGNKCNALSKPIPVGSKFLVKTFLNSGYIYGIVQSGQYKGQAGYISANCYVPK